MYFITICSCLLILINREQTQRFIFQNLDRECYKRSIFLFSNLSTKTILLEEIVFLSTPHTTHQKKTLLSTHWYFFWRFAYTPSRENLYGVNEKCTQYIWMQLNLLLKEVSFFFTIFYPRHFQQSIFVRRTFVDTLSFFFYITFQHFEKSFNFCSGGIYFIEFVA